MGLGDPQKEKLSTKNSEAVVQTPDLPAFVYKSEEPELRKPATS